MNLLPLLDNSKSEEYCYHLMLSDAAVDDEGVLYSNKYASEFDQEILDSLSAKGLIEVDEEGYVLLGYKKGATKFLYEGNPVDKEKYLGLIDDAYGTAIKYKKLRPNWHYDQAQALLFAKPERLGVNELGQLWVSVYTLFFQEEHRPLMGKERGQLRNLLNLYGPDKSVAILLEFLFSDGKYSSTPNIGHALYHKDKIWADITGKKIKSTKRAKGHEEDSY